MKAFALTFLIAGVAAPPLRAANLIPGKPAGSERATFATTSQRQQDWRSKRTVRMSGRQTAAPFEADAKRLIPDICIGC